MLDLFSGDTLEEAMAEAVAALGPGLEVRSARKVRSGVRGLMGRPVFEVLATPSGTADPETGDAAGGTAVHAVDLTAAEAGQQTADVVVELDRDARPGHDDHEAVPGLEPTLDLSQEMGSEMADTSYEMGQDMSHELELGAEFGQESELQVEETFVDQMEEMVGDDVVQDAVARMLAQADEQDIAPRPAPRPAAAPRVQRATPRPTPHPDMGVAAQIPAYAARSARPVPPPAAATRTPAPASPMSGAGWSRAVLRRMGVPAAILNELPSVDPADDWGWMAAFTEAVSRVVPAPVEPSPESPVVVSAYGLRGALVILDMGARGTAPGTITAYGRTTPASAMELSLVLHTTLTGR